MIAKIVKGSSFKGVVNYILDKEKDANILICDGLFVEVKRELTQLISAGGDGEEYLDLLMIAKYLERIADHATNIAEWVIFSITGIHEYAD